jgi:precorrin-2/cobalt-factor-2 C20-methyltransferase
MKVYKNFGEVAEILDNENLSENAVLVSRCGLQDEKIISDLNSHRNEKMNYLSTILTRRKI